MAYVRNRYLFISDLLLLGLAPFLAYGVRFEGFVWSAEDRRTALVYAGVAIVLKLGIFVLFGLYGRLWRRASMPDLAKIVEATGAATGACALVGLFLLPLIGITPLRVPISVSLLDSFLTITIVAAPRLIIRAIDARPRRAANGGKRALIVGAGAAGEMILRELMANPQLGLVAVAFVDDDRHKQQHRLHGVPVAGPLSAVRTVITRYGIEEIVIAMPTAPGGVVRDVVRAAMDAGVPTRTVPALFEILSGRVSLSNLRKVEIQDLLRREPVRTDLAPVRAIVSGRTVLVTGAGGSIGTELARQLARLGPAQIVLLGNGENEVFDILNELRDADPALQLVPVIADVRDLPRIRSTFRRLRPHAVFHAAAHKHVPLMEDNVADAVTNNVHGTENLVACAVECDTQHFVLISTDKAVRPTSIMGATKRVAEMIVQDAAARFKKNFVSVRFGNVLGSRGSVVPIFLNQIRARGPVTITHPEMRRYFMTIPEAVQLVLQAGASGRGGEVFVLDMGEPIKIVDLATDLIRLSGLEVGRDIEIRYTGIRPGERLSEEPFFRHEDVIPTEHPKILRATHNHPAANVGGLVDALVRAARDCRPDDELRHYLKTLVSDFGESAATDAPADRPSQPGHRRAWRAHGPAGRMFVERRADSERRVADRRVQVEPTPLAERRAGGQRRAVQRRAASQPATVMDSGAPTHRHSAAASL